MVCFRWYLVNPHVQVVQNMYGKGWVEGTQVPGCLRLSYGRPKVYPILKKAFAVFQKNISPNPRNWACPRKTKGRSDLRGEAQFRKFWSFFATPHNFANRPHFVALIQLQVAKTRSTKFCALQHPPKSAMIIGVFRVFLDKIDLPGQTVNFCL